MFGKNQDLIVKIRRESSYYLAYFIELRRIVPVNKIGAEIIDAFFNRNYSVEKIVELIGLKENLNDRDILSFLQDVRKEVVQPYEGGYPIVDKEQLDVPIAVEIQTNTTCNLRCRHCSQPDYSRVMPFRKIKGILEVLDKKGVFELNLTGGEFFLHPRALEIIQLSCKKYNFATIIITNGTLLTEEIIKKCVRFKHNLAFLVSLEGVGEINDEIRGRGVFDKVNKTIHLLKDYGFYVEISSTINKLNIKYYQDIIEYAKSLNVPLNFNLFKPFKKGHKDLVLDPLEYFEFVEDIFRQRRLYRANIGLTNAAIAGELMGHKKRKTCRATLSGLTIDVDGRMVPCPFLKEVGYYKAEKLPLFNEKFVDTWKHNYYFEKFRQGNLRECQACAYIFTGSVEGEDPYGIGAFMDYRKAKR